MNVGNVPLSGIDDLPKTKKNLMRVLSHLTVIHDTGDVPASRTAFQCQPSQWLSEVMGFSSALFPHDAFPCYSQFTRAQHTQCPLPFSWIPGFAPGHPFSIRPATILSLSLSSFSHLNVRRAASRGCCPTNTHALVFLQDNGCLDEW